MGGPKRTNQIRRETATHDATTIDATTIDATTTDATTTDATTTDATTTDATTTDATKPIATTIDATTTDATTTDATTTDGLEPARWAYRSLFHPYSQGDASRLLPLRLPWAVLAPPLSGLPTSAVGPIIIRP
jgi:hypothetical protein